MKGEDKSFIPSHDFENIPKELVDFSEGVYLYKDEAGTFCYKQTGSEGHTIELSNVAHALLWDNSALAISQTKFYAMLLPVSISSSGKPSPPKEQIPVSPQPEPVNPPVNPPANPPVNPPIKTPTQAPSPVQSPNAPKGQERSSTTWAIIIVIGLALCAAAFVGWFYLR